MRFNKLIAWALLLATGAQAAHLTDRSLYLTDVKNTANATVFPFPTVAPSPGFAAIWNANGEPAASIVSSSTLSFLDATSSVQTQLNAKQAVGNYLTGLTGDVLASGPGSVAATVASVGGSSASAVNTAVSLVNTSRAQNYFLAAPFSGSGAPSFRLIVASDIPTLNQNTTGNAATATTAGAFTSTPTGCAAGQYATAQAANGNFTCSAVPGTSLFTGTAGQALAAGDAVYMSVGSADGGRTAGQLYKVDATNANRIEFVGVATAAYSLGATATIQSAGQFSGMTGLSVGTPIYASVTTPGSFQSTAPTTIGQYIIQLGVASSSTAVVLNGAGSATATLITVPGGGAYSPTVQRFLSSGTFVVPANAIYIEIKGAAGGGGGGGSSNTSNNGGTGGTGGVTSFALGSTTILSAAGGIGGLGGGTPASGFGGSPTVNSPAIDIDSSAGGGGQAGALMVGTGNYGSGGMGGTNCFAGAGGGKAYDASSGGNSAAANSGGGGGGAGYLAPGVSGGGGGAGACFHAIINAPTPGDSYTVTIGVGGTAGAAGSGPGYLGGTGGSGRLEVTVFYAPGVVGTATNVTGVVARANGGTGVTTGPSAVLIASATASNSSSVDFTSISNTTFSSYELVGDNVIPVANAYSILLRVSVGGVFDATHYGWQNWRWTTSGQGVAGQAPNGATGIAINAAGADNLANTGSYAGISFRIRFYNASQTTSVKRCTYEAFYMGSALLGIVGDGLFTLTSAVDGFRFVSDGGNITSGTFKLYGYY